MESRSSSRAESVFAGSDCFYGVRKYRKMRAIPRRLSILVSQTKSWYNMKQLQSSLCWAFKETQRSSRTLMTKGYAANLHAAQANAELFTEMQQDHTLALENLATATQADRTSVALLTKTISELSIQVAHITAKLATSQAESDRLKNRDIVQPQPSTAIGCPKFWPR